MALRQLQGVAVLLVVWLVPAPAVLGQSDIRQMQQRNVEQLEAQLTGWDRELRGFDRSFTEFYRARAELPGLRRQAEDVARAAAGLRSRAEEELRRLGEGLQEFDRAEKAFYAARSQAAAAEDPTSSSVSTELGRMRTALDSAATALEKLTGLNEQLDAIASDPEPRSRAAASARKLSQGKAKLESSESRAAMALKANQSIEMNLEQWQREMKQELRSLELSRSSATASHDQKLLDGLIVRARNALSRAKKLTETARSQRQKVAIKPLEPEDPLLSPAPERLLRTDALLEAVLAAERNLRNLDRGSVGIGRADIVGARSRMEQARKSASLLQSSAPGTGPPPSPAAGTGTATGAGVAPSGSTPSAGSGGPTASPSTGSTADHSAAPTAPDHYGGLQITPQVRRIRVGEAVQLEAVDHGGREYSGAVWSCSNTRALAVSATGMIIGRLAGETAMVMVRVDNMGAILDVEVVAAEDTSATGSQPQVDTSGGAGGGQPAGASGGPGSAQPGDASGGQGGVAPAGAPGGPGDSQPSGVSGGQGGGQPGAAPGGPDGGQSGGGGGIATDMTVGGGAAGLTGAAPGGDTGAAGGAPSGADSGGPSGATAPGASGPGAPGGSEVSLLGAGTASGQPSAAGSAGPDGADVGGGAPDAGAAGQSPDAFLTSDLPDPEVGGTGGDGSTPGDGADAEVAAAELPWPVEPPGAGDGTPSVTGETGEAPGSGDGASGAGSGWAADWEDEPVEVPGGDGLATGGAAVETETAGGSDSGWAADWQGDPVVVSGGGEGAVDGGSESGGSAGGGEPGWAADWQGEPVEVPGGGEAAADGSSGGGGSTGSGDFGWAADWQAEPVEVADGGGAASDASAGGGDSGWAADWQAEPTEVPGGESTSGGDSDWGAEWQAEPVEVAGGDDNPDSGLGLLGETSHSVAEPPAFPSRPSGDPLAGDWMESVQAGCLEEHANPGAGGVCREFFSQMKAAGCYLDPGKGNFAATDWTPRFADGATQMKIRNCRLKSMRLVQLRPEHRTATKGVVRILRTGSGYSGRSLEDYGSPGYGMIQQKGPFRKEGTLGPGTQVMRGLRKASGHDYYLGECLVAHDFTALPKFWTRCMLEIVAEGRALLGLFWRPELYWVNVEDRQSWARAGTSRAARVVGLLRIRAGQPGGMGSSTTSASGASGSGNCWVGCKPAVRPLSCAVACDGQFSATTALARSGRTDYKLKNATWAQCEAKMRELGQAGW